MGKKGNKREKKGVEIRWKETEREKWSAQKYTHTIFYGINSPLCFVIMRKI